MQFIASTSGVVSSVATELDRTMTKRRQYRLTVDVDAWYRITTPGGPAASPGGGGSILLLAGESAMVEASDETHTRVSIVRDSVNGTALLSAIGRRIIPPAVTTPTTLSVTVADSKDPVITEVNFSYTATVTNTGAADASNLTLTFTLDSHTTFVSASGTDWICNESGGVVTCTHPGMGAGLAAPAITITVTTPTTAQSLSAGVSVVADNATTPATDTEATTCALVTRDATQHKRYPATTSEWQSLIDYYGLELSAGVPLSPPDSIYLLQQASGNATDVGSANITLTASGTWAYQQTDAALSRFSVKTTDNTAADMRSTSSSLPDISSTNFTSLTVVKIVTSTGGNRTVSQMGTTQAIFRCNSTPRSVVASGTNSTTGSTNPTGSFRPHVIDVKAGVSSIGYTDQEKIAPTLGALTGKRFGIGGISATPPTALHTYSCNWFNTHAGFGDAATKAMLQALEWTVTGY